MQIAEKLQRIVTPRAFVRIMLGLAALWFLGIWPVLNWFYPQFLPWEMKVRRTAVACDFRPYYIGALVVKNNRWDVLYPLPKVSVYNESPTFKPMWETALFNKTEVYRKIYAYPFFGGSLAGDLVPGLIELYPTLAFKKEAYWNYIYPPPAALLFYPMAFVDMQTMEYKLWPTLCILSFFGVAYYASRIHRVLAGKVTYTEGFVVAFFLLFSFRGIHVIADGNISPILSFLIAFIAYSWIRGRQTAVGLALIPLLLIKSLCLNWCPLLLFKRIQWKTLFVMAGLTLLFNGVTLYLAGGEIYRHYFTEILPKITVPIGWGIVPLVFFALGVYPAKLYVTLNATLCIALYWGYWRASQREATKDSAAPLLATLAGTMAVFCLLNFSVWSSYYPLYLYFPFLGWLLWEQAQARGKWKIAIRTILIVCFMMMWKWLFDSLTYHFGALTTKDWFYLYLLQALVVPPFVLILAFRRLFFMQKGDSLEPASGSTNPG